MHSPYVCVCVFVCVCVCVFVCVCVCVCMVSTVQAFAMLPKQDGCHGDNADMHAQVLLTHLRIRLVKLCNDHVSKTNALDVMPCVCVGVLFSLSSLPCFHASNNFIFTCAV